MLSQEPWNNAPSWGDRPEPIPVRVKEEPKSARHEILGLHGYAPKDARVEAEAPPEKTRAAEARRRASPSPETTWPEKPKEEKASDDAPPAIALAEAEALTEKKRAAAPDATWPEKHKEDSCDGCLVGSLEHLEECLRTTRPAPVLPRDPAQMELSIFQLIDMEEWLKRKISTPTRIPYMFWIGEEKPSTAGTD